VINRLVIAATLSFVTVPTFSAEEVQLKRGEYIFHLSGCSSCRTDIQRKGMLLAGGAGLKHLSAYFMPQTSHQTKPML
jgi:hypothetical protein